MSSKLKNKRILISGGAGFIGSNLIDKFIKNNNVRCLDNFSTGHRDNIIKYLNHRNFELIEGDITEYNICSKATIGIDIVFHHAALGSVPRSIENPIGTNLHNVTGFLNLLEASRRSNVKRFIFASSSSVYGDHPGLPKVENLLGKAKSPYAVSKLANEQYARIYSELYGIETIGLRYFNVFGRNQSPQGEYAAVIPKFISAFRSGKPITIHGDGSQTRDFTHVSNVVLANELAATTTKLDALNQVYNIAYGSQISLIDLVEIIRNRLRIANVDVSKSQLIFGASRLGDIKDSFASIEKAIKLLGFEPSTGVEEGINELLCI